MCGCVDVWMCGCVLYHPPSIITLTHSLAHFVRSLRSFVASPVHSYGVNARVIFVVGGLPPYWFIERSYRRLVAEPPELPPLGGGTPRATVVGGRNPPISLVQTLLYYTFRELLSSIISQNPHTIVREYNNLLMLFGISLHT